MLRRGHSDQTHKLLASGLPLRSMAIILEMLNSVIIHFLKPSLLDK
jgi:hypothetical protein